MSDITLEGLTQRQWAMADILWHCDTKEDVKRFIAGLPTQELKAEALSVHELMCQAVQEQNMTDFDQAKDLLDKFTK
jgi:hypothetical protein